MTKDPICGMIVNEATAIHAERDGVTFLFCGEPCRQTFLSAPDLVFGHAIKGTLTLRA